ncbi:MAG TPA: alpha/beta fold hydrolase [Capillimicrobium sp.]|jgi:pimeloyl-ACP methyl ester carboxylesterase
MPTIEGAGVELAYEETLSPAPADGRTVLLVHGMGADRFVWADTVAALRGEARVIAYDRRAYGDSGAPEPYARTTVAEQAEDAAALLLGLHAAPAVVVGADLGALVALDLLLRHRALVPAAVLIDPPAFPLVPEANEALAAERALLERVMRDAGPGAAVRAWLAGRGIAGDRAERAAARPRAFFADFGGQATLALSRRELRALDAPVAILDGPGAPHHVRAAADALAALLPGARRAGAEPPADAARALLAG